MQEKIQFKVREDVFNEYFHSDTFNLSMETLRWTANRYLNFIFILTYVSYFVLIIIKITSITVGDRIFSGFVLMLMFMWAAVFYYTQREKLRFIYELKLMINDPKLLKMNFGQKKKKFTSLGDVIKYYTPEGLSQSQFQILSFLHNEGYIHGMYKYIPTLANSSSLKKTLKRMSGNEKMIDNTPIIHFEDYDYKYVPWYFKLADKNGNLILQNENLQVPKDKVRNLKMIEHNLNILWGMVLNYEYKRMKKEKLSLIKQISSSLKLKLVQS